MPHATPSPASRVTPSQSPPQGSYSTTTVLVVISAKDGTVTVGRDQSETLTDVAAVVSFEHQPDFAEYSEIVAESDYYQAPTLADTWTELAP